jgi:uncharacterized protein
VSELFVDTSAWMAIVDARDANHGAATAFQAEIDENCRLVITNYILDELLTLVLMDLGYRRAVDVKSTLDRLGRDGILDVVWVDAALAESAWSVFERFNRDKQWSFTDCVSFAAMKARAMNEAFAFDHHFDQMGFARKP